MAPLRSVTPARIRRWALPMIAAGVGLLVLGLLQQTPRPPFPARYDTLLGVVCGVLLMGGLVLRFGPLRPRR